MRQLTFMDLSNDGLKLVLQGKDGQIYQVVIDERLVAAVRRDRTRLGQIELETEDTLRPRDIQARIRAGASAEEVAALAGLSIERIRRYEGPVLAERAWVADLASKTELRRNTGDVTLRQTIVETLEGIGIDVERLEWDSWRREDGRWNIQLTYPTTGGESEALWIFDAVSRTMTWENELAKAFTEGGPLPVFTAEDRPRLVGLAAVEEPDEAAVDSADDAPTIAEDVEDIITEEIPFPTDEAESATEAETEPADPAVVLAEELLTEVAEAELFLAEVATLAQSISESDSKVTAEDPASDHVVAAAEVEAPAAKAAPAEARRTREVDAEQSSLLGEAEVISLVDKSGPARASRAQRIASGGSATASGTSTSRAAAEIDGAGEESPATAARKSRRAQVPSWDDILFGTKPAGE